MPKISKHFHLEVTPEQFLQACSPDEIQELNILLQAGQYQVKMLNGNTSEVVKWMELYTEGEYTVEELRACAFRIDTDQNMPRQEKVERLLALTHVLTTYSGTVATDSAREVLELAQKHRP